MNKWVGLTEGKEREGKRGANVGQREHFLSHFSWKSETLDSLWCCLCGQRPSNPATNKAFFPPNSDSLSELVNSRVQSAGAKNGPCGKPTEPALGLQWWSQLDLSGRDRSKDSFPLLIRRKSQQLSEEGYCIKAVCNSLLRQLPHVFADWQGLKWKGLSSTLDHFTIPHARPSSSAGRSGWHHPPFQIMPLFPTKHAAAILKKFLVWGELRMCSLRLSWISLRMELQDQRKLHCRPNPYSLSALACVYNHDRSSSSFLPWEAPSWTRWWFFRGSRCLFEVLRSYLGIFHREEVWEEEISRFGCQNSSLFGVKTAPPGGKQMCSAWSLQWQALHLPTLCRS